MVCMFYEIIWSHWDKNKTKRDHRHVTKCTFFPVFSSPELKAQLNFFSHLSSICQSVRLSVHSLTFHIFISRTTGSISMKLGTKHPLMKGIQVCSNEGPRPSPRWDNYEIAKIHFQNLKIFFSRTIWPISTKLGTKHPWVKGIQVF